MCVDYRNCFPSSSRLTLSSTSTPPTLYYDQISNNDGSVSEQETILESPSNAIFNHNHNNPPQFLINQDIQYPLSAKKIGKRPASPTLVTPAFSPSQIPSKKKNKMDMNMAKTGSIAAQSAFQTPLATYVAQMVVWLWYGDFAPQADQPPSSPLSHTHIPNDPFDVNHATSSHISALMVHPSPDFGKFVTRMLNVTSVSHSVAIIALLYIYRLKMRNGFFSTPGSEQRPFIAGLMLGNKYLDDNTYTNATWAELAGMTLPEVNKMESEFLTGLNYQLGVSVEEYTRWKNLLDGFMTSRAPHSATTRHIRHASNAKSPLTMAIPITPASIPPMTTTHRARSASPPRIAPPPIHTANYDFPTGYDHARKRSAVDASMHDPSTSAAIYEFLRLPSRKAAFQQPLQSTQHLQPNVNAVRAKPTSVQQSFGASTVRSSSLSRQGGRMAQDGQSYGRRGSHGHIFPTPMGYVSHHVSPIAVDDPTFMAGPTEWDGGRALLAPYECQPQPHLVPPEHLMFYSLAAGTHTGIDGAPRKAILCYQEPDQFPYAAQNAPYVSSHYPVPSASMTPTYPYEDVTMYDGNVSPQTAFPSNNVYQYPAPTAPAAPPMQQNQTQHQTQAQYAQGLYNTTYWSPNRVIPEPAQFANAGPPGYTYVPTPAPISQDTMYKAAPSAVPHGAPIGLGLDTTMPMNMDGQMVYTPNGVVYHTPTPDGMMGQWASRSEWSSPLMGVPRYN
ncbi:uncharacterized protein I303_100797 [Kwoniella dejecticola CBS 10117]|uniref:Cyclin N-terminal domain-containing protein n=1 Tax=Kwoniella dejecticola CBS 10117 TaxID=1296121 RepID=A0A1A6AFZ7_9TREE|nr:uncharacterized protein I303_00799 [Kwoniella dejecticola CBS 10117]OBR88979.1 hypothetical protein I303_00799 [Kwoniella dejecticola CBS 10117]